MNFDFQYVQRFYNKTDVICSKCVVNDFKKNWICRELLLSVYQTEMHFCENITEKLRKEKLNSESHRESY